MSITKEKITYSEVWCSNTTVKPTLQTSAETLVFWLTVWVERVATCASKLLSLFGISLQELIEIFQNVSSVTSIFWRQVCEFLRKWATEHLPRSSRSPEKSCTVSSRCWRPANRNIIQRSFFAKIINIDRNDSLDVSEAFRNASPCGSDSYRRVYLKVREWLFVFIEKTLWFERGKRGKYVNKVTQEPSFLVCEQSKFWEIVSGRRFWLENFQRKSAMVEASKS